MKHFEIIRKPSKKIEEGEIKKVAKKKSYNGPKRIRGSFRILQEEEMDGGIYPV